MLFYRRHANRLFLTCLTITLINRCLDLIQLRNKVNTLLEQNVVNTLVGKSNEPTTQQLKSSRSHEPQTTRLQRFNQVCQTKFKSYKTEVCQTGKKLSNYKRQSLPLSCSGSKPTWSAFNFIADHKRKIMICIPPKTGCTTWQKMWLSINNTDLGYLNDTNENPKFSVFKQTPRFDKHMDSENFHKLTADPSWKKVVNTRHPFERIHSGWRDKFNSSLSRPKWKLKGVKQFVSRYLDEIETHQIRVETTSEMAVSFENFLHYIANSEYTNWNVHFKPVSFFCTPCEINYDFITDGETLTTDVLQFLRQIKLENNEETFLNDLERQQNNFSVLKPYKSHKNAQNEFLEISKRNETLIQLVYDKFKWDFAIFGYSTFGYRIDT